MTTTTDTRALPASLCPRRRWAVMIDGRMVAADMRPERAEAIAADWCDQGRPATVEDRWTVPA